MAAAGGEHGLGMPVLLQVPKSLRFLTWMLWGRIGPLAAARCVALQWWGVAAGYAKGMRCKPQLPLSPEGEAG